ncbi:hypothetical protein [Streptomyces sp. TLI_053]|uniref:hypothetical protein n=1 Tax=Streptomyces sp. TLI_053 TaxID=1855352 RepID=UPI0013520AA6|nr:hypothetical protein [Streptomyces sp. TLI_053]
MRHDPSSAVPFDRLVAAVGESRTARTGDRPSGIRWVTGESNGQRHDRPVIED